MKLICTSFSFFFLLNLALGQNNSFSGTFLNTEIGLKLTLKENNANYSGNFSLQGQSFPITAQKQDANTLLGTYPYQGNQVPIQLTNMAGNYFLISEGMTIPMTFQSGAITETVVESQAAPALNAIAKTTNKKANGKLFKDPYAGFQFNIPQDWLGRQLEDGSFLIGHNTKHGFISVMPHQYNSIQELTREASQGLSEGEIQLNPITSPQRFGKNGLVVDYAGYIQGQACKAQGIGLVSPNGGGVILLVGVDQANYSAAYPEIIQSIANSVRFFKPKTSALATQWKQRLNGKRLQYYKTENGFSDKITIDLCRSGNFGYNSNSSGLSTGGYSNLTYAGQDKGQGTWKIMGRGNQSILMLSFHNGEQYEYTLSKRSTNGQINLNGKRYFVLNENGCY